MISSDHLLVAEVTHNVHLDAVQHSILFVDSRMFFCDAVFDLWEWVCPALLDADYEKFS